MAEQFFKLRDVCARYKLGPTKIYEDIKKGAFPEPDRFGENTVRWRGSKLDAFDATLPSGVATVRTSGRRKAAKEAA